MGRGHVLFGRDVTREHSGSPIANLAAFIENIISHGTAEINNH